MSSWSKHASRGSRSNPTLSQAGKQAHRLHHVTSQRLDERENRRTLLSTACRGKTSSGTPCRIKRHHREDTLLGAFCSTSPYLFMRPAFAVGWPRETREHCSPHKLVNLPRGLHHSDAFDAISFLHGSDFATPRHTSSAPPRTGRSSTLHVTSVLLHSGVGWPMSQVSQISFASFTKADIVSSATSPSTSCPSSTEVTSTISHASVCNDKTRSSVRCAPP